MQLVVVESRFGTVKSIFALFEMARKRNLGDCEAIVRFIFLDTVLLSSLGWGDSHEQYQP